VGVGRGPGPLRSAGIGSPGCGHPDKAGPAARVSSARHNVACPACIARSASRSGPAADWHAGKVAASGRSIRPTRLTQGGPRHSQKRRACAFAVIGHAAAALKRPMISRRRIAVLKLDRASVTVRTWGLEGGRGLFEMEFSFGSAFPPWVKPRRTQIEHSSSVLPPTTDIAPAMFSSLAIREYLVARKIGKLSLTRHAQNHRRSRVLGVPRVVGPAS
jgi:hypothetical protein